MKHNPNDIPDAEPEIRPNAVSIYGQDAGEDFPVLKAFQQYIDAEQAKARKRLVSLGIFFGILMGAVIAVFVLLLMYSTHRNQELNDRLIDFVMKERERGSSPVVVQPPAQSDSAALIAMTAKLEQMQKDFAESQAKSERGVKEAQEKADRAIKDAEERANRAIQDARNPRPPSAEELEIRRLKAQLAAEREKADETKELKRQMELEAYRRKYYPELYAPQPQPVTVPARPVAPRRPAKPVSVADEDASLDNLDAISYFGTDDEDELDEAPQPKRPQTKKPAVAPKKQPKPAAKPVAKPSAAKPAAKASAQPESPSPTDEKQNSIPVDVRGSSTEWLVPEE